MKKDVTKQIGFEDCYGEYIQMIKCLCGADFHLDFVIGLFNNYFQCPECHRQFFVKRIVKIYEIQYGK